MNLMNLFIKLTVYCWVIVKNGKNISKKHFLKPFHIKGYKRDVVIIQKYCGFSIKELYK